MSPEVEPRFKIQGECGGNKATCSLEDCPKFGTLRKDGKVKGCMDAASRGGRNRRSGLAKQRKARKLLGVPDRKYGSQMSNEESWAWRFRVEVKSGAQVRPVWTRFLLAEAQSEASKSIGDPRPFLFVAMPDGSSEGLIVMRASDWNAHIAPLLGE